MNCLRCDSERVTDNGGSVYPQGKCYYLCEDCWLAWSPETLEYSYDDEDDWHEVPEGCLAVFSGKEL